MKGFLELIVRAVINLYHGAKTKVRVGYELSEEFLDWWYRLVYIKGLCLWPLLFAITVTVITQNAREGLINEILYADDLVLMS